MVEFKNPEPEVVKPGEHVDLPNKNEFSEDYLLKLTFAALQEGTIVTDPVDRIMCLEREVTRHVIHEHVNESSTLYKNSDILRRRNDEH